MVSEQISGFLNFVREAGSQHSMAKQDEEQTYLETQDILHSLEIHDHQYDSLANIAEMLTDVRRRRRAAKDSLAVYEPIAAWVDENKTVLKSLERLLGDVRKAESFQKNRCYVNRTSILEEVGGCDDCT